MHARTLQTIARGTFLAWIVETYIKWLGYDRTWPRWLMFVGGTMLSIILTIGVLATELLPDQD